MASGGIANLEDLERMLRGLPIRDPDNPDTAYDRDENQNRQDGDETAYRRQKIGGMHPNPR